MSLLGLHAVAAVAASLRCSPVLLWSVALEKSWSAGALGEPMPAVLIRNLISQGRDDIRQGMFGVSQDTWCLEATQSIVST